VKIINEPVMNITMDTAKNCNSPKGRGISIDSINILNKGPFIGRKNNTRKIPNFCLSIIAIRVGPHISNSSVNRIDLEMLYFR
jgi:hypothetical protein